MGKEVRFVVTASWPPQGKVPTVCVSLGRFGVEGDGRGETYGHPRRNRGLRDS